MNHSERQLLEFVSRLTYNIEGLSPSMKLYVSQVLTFHFSNKLSEDFIRDVENKRAAKPFKTSDELRSASSDFSIEEKAWCVGILVVLKEQALDHSNKKLSINIDRLIKELTDLFGLGNEIIARQHSDIKEEIDRFQNRKVIRIPVSIWPLVLDFALRCALLIYASAIWHDTSNLIAFNVTIIPGIVLLIGYIVSRRHRKRNTKLLDGYGGSHQFKIESSVTAAQYTWIAFFLAISVFISYLLPDQLHALAFFGLTVYYLIFLRFFHVGRLDENDLMRQLEHNVGAKEYYTVDQNDEQIVTLETKLNSFTSRLDAYVLESALFGALTFSGFLQIMASDMVSFTDLDNFATHVFNTSRGLINLQWDDFDEGLGALNSKVSLLCLVSVESLVCSGFFLAVIASRLRFSDVADKVRTSIEMAKVYNAKEEALVSEHEVTERKPGRLQDLTERVSEQIHLAVRALERVNPVMTYMRYFRNAGILVFVGILITSSLFITSVLGWTFIAMVGATFAYFNYSNLNLTIRATLLNFRITFITRAARFLIIALLPFVLSVAISSISSEAASTLIALGYLATGVYIFAWLILAAHADQNFGEIENSKDVARTGRWLLVKNTLAFTMLVWALGNTFKQMHLTGADEMIIVSLSALAILMYFVGYYLSKVRWLGVICGWILAVIAIGVLFKTLDFPGAEEMLKIALSTLVVLTPLLIWQRKRFHALFIRFTGITIVLTAVFASGAILKIRIAASHRTLNVGEIEDVLRANHVRELLDHPETIQAGIEKCDWYIKTYNDKAGYEPIYLSLLGNYEYYLDIQVKANSTRDTTSLTNALTVARQANKIRSLFAYQVRSFSPDDASMESTILLALGRRDEARQSLETIMYAIPDPDLKNEISKRLADIPR